MFDFTSTETTTEQAEVHQLEVDTQIDERAAFTSLSGVAGVGLGVALGGPVGAIVVGAALSAMTVGSALFQLSAEGE